MLNEWTRERKESAPPQNASRDASSCAGLGNQSKLNAIPAGKFLSVPRPPISNLPKAQRQSLLDDLNYLNMAEIQVLLQTAFYSPRDCNENERRPNKKDRRRRPERRDPRKDSPFPSDGRRPGADPLPF